MIIVLLCLAFFCGTIWFVAHRVRIILRRAKVQHQANEAVIAREQRERHL